MLSRLRKKGTATPIRKTSSPLRRSSPTRSPITKSTSEEDEAVATAAALAAGKLREEAAQDRAASAAVAHAEEPVVEVTLVAAVEALAHETAATRAAAAAAADARARRKAHAAALMSGKAQRRMLSMNMTRRGDDDDNDASTAAEENLHAVVEAATARLVNLAGVVGDVMNGALGQAVAWASGYTDEQQAATTRLQRFQRVRRDRRRWERYGRHYWQYAHELEREKAAVAVQQWVRAVWEGRFAREAIDDLRAWDSLVEELGETRRRRTAAALVLQRNAQTTRRERRAREWRKRELRKRSSRIWARTQHFTTLLKKEEEAQRLNPFSATYYIGAEQHRKVVEAAAGGKLGRFGRPSEGAAEKALSGQVATLLNVLRLVDAVNAIISMKAHGSTSGQEDKGEEAHAGDGASGERHSLHFDDLMNWNGQAVQDRFSGAVQYLRSAKKHGLLDFNGEMPQGTLIESRCMRWSRRALLDFAMAQLHLVVPTLPQQTGSTSSSESPVDTLRRRILIEFAQQLDEFTNSSFDLDVVAPRPIDRNAGGVTA